MAEKKKKSGEETDDKRKHQKGMDRKHKSFYFLSLFCCVSNLGDGAEHALLSDAVGADHHQGVGVGVPVALRRGHSPGHHVRLRRKVVARIAVRLVAMIKRNKLTIKKKRASKRKDKQEGEKKEGKKKHELWRKKKADQASQRKKSWKKKKKMKNMMRVNKMEEI